MIDHWFSFVICAVALISIHEGLARSAATDYRSHVLKPHYLGCTVLICGATIFYWNAQGLKSLADALQPPIIAMNLNSRVDELEKMPLPQRKELSKQWARAVFVGGGNLLDVVDDEGEWMPYSPTADEIKGRDRQLKTISQLDLQRQELIAAAQAATNQSVYWLIGLVIAVCTGLLTKRMQNIATKN